MLKQVSVLGVVILLWGCSGTSDNGGEHLPPLTLEQKSELKGFNESLGHVGEAVDGAAKEVQKNKGTGSTLLRLFSNGNMSSMNELNRRKIDKMKKALGQCNFVGLDEADNKESRSVDQILSEGIIVKVDGIHCPLGLMAKLQVNRVGESISGEFVLDFFVQDLDMIRLSGLKSANFRGTVSGTNNQVMETVSTMINGNILTTETGELKLVLEGHVQDDKDKTLAQIIQRYAFPSFVAQGKMVLHVNKETGKQSKEFRINGSIVSEKEFLEHFGSGPVAPLFKPNGINGKNSTKTP